MLRAGGARVLTSALSEAVHDLATDEVTTITDDIAEEETARRTVALALERSAASTSSSTMPGGR